MSSLSFKADIVILFILSSDSAKACTCWYMCCTILRISNPLSRRSSRAIAADNLEAASASHSSSDESGSWGPLQTLHSGDLPNLIKCLSISSRLKDDPIPLCSVQGQGSLLKP
ncbi:hypothetical protein KC19_11G139800 [Ceratodon purpureus]|uniref:Secreted protein n=1 Tax=Ceratodon purpureus TaxID=3225 RepID=A0A8T0GFZ0_CERPU|nr:hypothetical protein KC19_11G139800 [Ceratodon purpureus]